MLWGISRDSGAAQELGDGGGGGISVLLGLPITARYGCATA